MQNFARRPELAGKLLSFLSNGTLRGSIRRNDPDGVSTDPYFATPAESTLVIVLDNPDTIFTVNITANISSKAAVAAINAVIGGETARGVAYEQDGTLYIQTLKKGSAGYVEVTGDTAAAALGFDLARGRQISRGGDFDSAPEGRLGNPYTSGFPVRGENLNSRSYVRALGRLATNLDVLYAEHSRLGTQVANVATLSSAGQTLLASGTLGLLSVSTSQRLSIGYGQLTRTSTPQEIAPYFTLIDAATKRVAQSAVVAVVVGAVTGAPPYSVAADLAGATPGSVLGVDFVRLGPLSIDNIQDGRFVYRASGGFGAVKVGDLAEITGADETTNTDPWDNRGMRWVVEDVSTDGKTVTLRPMSASELDFYSIDVPDNHPVVELNSAVSVGQTFGSITFHTGPFMENLEVVVQPPLPPGGSYELWARVPCSLRDVVGYEGAYDAKAALSEALAPTDSVASTLLSRPTFSVPDANTLSVGTFYARWRGRAVSIPAQATLSISGYSGSAVVAYWDPADALVKVTNAVTAPAGTAPLCQVNSAHNAVIDITRLPTELKRSATVGTNGQFPNIQQALNHLLYLSGEAFEIVVLEDATAPTGGWTVPVPSLRVRGATPDINLAHGASGPLFTVSDTNGLVLEDLVVDLTKTIASGTSPNIVFRNLHHVSGGQHRTLDVLNDNVDVGHDAPGVDLGKSGTQATVRGGLTVNEATELKQAVTADTTVEVKGVLTADVNAEVKGDLTVDGNLSLPDATKQVQVGSNGSGGSGGVELSVSGSQGQLVLSKNGESDVALTKDNVDVLVGGTGSNSDALHRHAANAVDVGSTSAIRTGSDAKSQLEELDAAVAARLTGFGAGTPFVVGGTATVPYLSMPIVSRSASGYISSALFKEAIWPRLEYTSDGPTIDTNTGDAVTEYLLAEVYCYGYYLQHVFIIFDGQMYLGLAGGAYSRFAIKTYINGTLYATSYQSAAGTGVHRFAYRTDYIWNYADDLPIHIEMRVSWVAGAAFKCDPNATPSTDGSGQNAGDCRQRLLVLAPNSLG